MATNIISKGFKTIEELQDAVYSSEVLETLSKADAPLTSSTAGAFNTVYGAEAWSQLNQKSNTWGVLPKKPFQQSGFRMETSYPASLGTGGVAENLSTLPDTIKPTFAEAVMTIKTIQHTYNDTEIKELRYKSNDDDLGIDSVRAAVQRFHVKSMNKMLSADAGTAAAGVALESIDRVVSSQAEAVADTGNEANYDIYGFDRSAVTTIDSNIVDQAAAGIAKADVRSLLSAIDTASGERPNVFITDNDGADILETLYEDQLRYNGAGRVSVGVNGIQTNAGDDVGLTVSMIAGIPLIRDPDLANGYLYALNTEFIWVEIALPTQNEESSDRLLIDSNGTKGVFTTVAELKCVNFKAHGKLRGATGGNLA